MVAPAPLAAFRYHLAGHPGREVAGSALISGGMVAGLDRGFIVYHIRADFLSVVPAGVSIVPMLARPINPPASLLGSMNAVVTGTSCRYQVADFEGCLSLKTVTAGKAVWQAGGRHFAVRENCFLILNDRQHYAMDIHSAKPVTTFCLFFARGFVEDVWRATCLPDHALLDAPPLSRADLSVGFFERLEPESSPVLQRSPPFPTIHQLRSRTGILGRMFSGGRRRVGARTTRCLRGRRETPCLARVHQGRTSPSLAAWP